MSGTGTEGLTAAQKRALLERLLKDEAGAQPLSAGQKALWFLHQLAPRSSAYNVAWTAWVRSPLDVAALSRALRRLSERHEMLRARFTTRNGEPMQRFARPDDPVIGEHDARGLNREQLEKLLVAANDQPFDLVNGPVFRADVWHLGAAEHVVQLSVHHIAFDGWSVAIAVPDLMALYGAEVSGAAAVLPPAPANFASYAAWQRELVDGPAGQRMWEYWKERLGGSLPVLALPTDHARPPEPSYAGGKVSFLLGEEETQRLRQLARDQGATLFMTVLAVFGVLLHRYTGQEEVLIGSPTAGRSRTDFEGIVGYLVNPVVLRLSTAGVPSFAAYLAQVRERVVEALRNADLPFPLLVQKLNPERDPSRSPLFQVDFNMLRAIQLGPDGGGAAQGGSLAQPTLGRLVLESFSIPQQQGQFDLGFEIMDNGRELAANLKYASDLFEPATVERIAGHLKQLVTSVLEAPDRKISQLRMLTAAEEQAIRGFNSTARVYPDERPIHRGIEDQARAAPDAVALRFEGQSLTYSQLDRQANGLALRLRAAGVGAGVLVGIVAERSFEMVVGLLAILKAGGAYVPFDPTYPPDRLGFMFEDTQAQVILVQPRLEGALPAHAARVLELAAEDGADEAPPGDESLDSLAYVIFTSGSTGRPKGAMNAHRGILNRLSWMQEEYRLQPADRVLQKTPYSFDVSVWEFFWPLREGATLVIARPDGHKDPAYLAQLIRDEGVTTLHFVPSMLQAFVEEETARSCSSVKRVICSGEALPHDLQERFFDVLPACELHNLYGPTEAAVDVTYWACQRNDGRSSVPIGRPVANTQIHLLDAHGQQVPVGVPGELWIGGVQVGLGYCNRNELTEERFVPDPFRDQPDARMYRTGDLARYRSGGEIEYLGRTDHQVKIRGFRIELGEIEERLLAHTHVEQAVVVARDFGNADRRLVAFVTGGANQAVDVTALKSHLLETLPTYMVPTAFVVLDSLPLTASGKADRKALMAMDVAGPAADVPEVPLTTRTEEIVAGIWSEVLGTPVTSAAADFFALGGHSLSVAQVAARLRKALGTTIPFREVFAARDLAALAARIDATRIESKERDSSAGPASDADTGETTLSSVQQRLWFLNELGGDTAEYAMVGAIELAGSLDRTALEGALAQLVVRHESLRTIFRAPGGDPVQVIQPAGHFVLEMEDVPSEEALRSRMKSAATRIFDLQSGPLFRCVLYRTARDRHYLLLILHHIIADGWSIGVLLRELATLYTDTVLGKPSSLPAPLLQYRDYARWQREQAGDGDYGGALARWVARLDGAPRELELPSDRPRPPAESHRGATLPFRLPMELAEGLRTLSRRQGATLFMTLLALFDTLLWKYTGQQDLVVGTPVANRPRVELESLVGVFVNTLLLRTRLEPSLTFAEALGRVRDTTLDALGDEQVPFERLVQALRPERDLGRNPLFQVMFVLQNMPQRPVDLPGLQLRALDVDRGAAQLDLTLYMVETAEGLSGFVEYATDLFDADRIARMTGHFEQLARAVVAWPAARLGELDMLTETEHGNVASWNRTARPEPTACVHDLVAATAARQPDATGLVFGDASLTYSELETRAAAIAGRLAALGVRPGRLVGVLLERGPDMVAGVLGVLKAGAGYVPMDPAFPSDRLAYMLEDSGASVLLTQESLAGSIATDARVLVLERFADGDPVAVPVAATLDDLAYVIYTSGSTGKPKGVAIGHRSLVNLLASMQEEPGFTAADSLFAVTTLSFDIAGLELYLPLIAGGRIVLASRDDVADGNALVERLEASRATVMQATPATWRLMLEADWKGSPGLKVLCGGEALPRDLADALAPRVKELWNVYGPTETTIWSSCERVRVAPGPIAIGRPIANTSLLILDRSGGLAPVGVPGELHIAGMGLAHGYWRRDDLTAERFIPDQVSGQPGKLYKTGDQARWLPDGRVECLGRLDHQVKVRGYRIELEEIEIALRAHPDVDQSVVVAQKGDGGDDRLIAYLTEVSGRPANVTELRAHLRKTLPAYMVPSAFVTLDRLPLTANGKIDRKALIGIESARAVRGEPLPPRTPAELLVAQVWRDALKVPLVGLQDNFFDLGGHSLLAMRVLAEIEKLTGTRLHPRDIIFQNLEQLAKACAARVSGPPLGEPAADTDGKLRGLLRRLRPGAAGGKR